MQKNTKQPAADHSNIMGLRNLPMAFRKESALVANVVTYINVYVHGAHARTRVSSRVTPNESDGCVA